MQPPPGGYGPPRGGYPGPYGQQGHAGQPGAPAHKPITGSAETMAMHAMTIDPKTGLPKGEKPPASPAAVLSLVCGILLCLGPMTGLTAIVAGLVARGQAQRRPHRHRRGPGRARSGVTPAYRYGRRRYGKCRDCARRAQPAAVCARALLLPVDCWLTGRSGLFFARNWRQRRADGPACPGRSPRPIRRPRSSSTRRATWPWLVCHRGWRARSARTFRGL